MDETPRNRLANFLAINRTVGIVLLTVLLFGLGEQLWEPFVPLILKSQTKEYAADTAATGSLSNVALWSIGIYAFLLNLFQGFCYIGGGQLTAWLGDRGSLIFFGLLTIGGYVIFLAIPHPWATVLACLLILGWESLSMPVTFTTVGATLVEEKRGMAFAVQSIQKRLPKIIGPLCIGAVTAYLGQFYDADETMRVSMPLLVGAAFALGVASVIVQWRFMPHRSAPASADSYASILRQFPPNLRRLLLADILTRWCDWLVRALVVVYLATERRLRPDEIAWLMAMQHTVALLTYLPIGQMTRVVGLQPFIGLTFVFFALFPLTLILVPNDWMWFAFVVYGMREIGEPARKAMITTGMPESIRARGVGLYWGIRAFAICGAALVGAWLWQVHGPDTLFYSAFGMGVVAILVYYGLVGSARSPTSVTK
jgi:MFS family permease